MKHPAIRELYRYWDRIRDGAPAATRGAIEPAEIRGILGDVFILDAARTQPSFRLAGTRLCATFARELRGVDFASLWAAAARPEIALLLRTVREDFQPVLGEVTAMTVSGRVGAFDLLLLPLIQDGPGCDRILGVLAPADMPAWLGLDPLTGLRTRNVRLLPPADGDEIRVAAPFTRTVSGFPAPRRRFIVLEGGKAGR